MNYGNKLKELREENKVYQTDIANILNIARVTYNHYENQENIIPLKYLLELCNYFDVSLDYVFSLNNIKKYNNIRKELDIKTIGMRLKTWRKENKLTQGKLAEKLNIARAMIGKYENGDFLISTHTLYTICKKYNISADYLLDRIDEPKYLK